MIIGKGKRAKCTYCSEMKDNLAEHIKVEHLEESHPHTIEYLIQELMIQIDQMENKITQLQDKH